MACEGSFKSPEIFAPAMMPVAAGKNTAKTEKKPSLLMNAGPMFSMKSSTAIY